MIGHYLGVAWKNCHILADGVVRFLSGFGKVSPPDIGCHFWHRNNNVTTLDQDLTDSCAATATLPTTSIKKPGNSAAIKPPNCRDRSLPPSKRREPCVCCTATNARPPWMFSFSLQQFFLSPDAPTGTDEVEFWPTTIRPLHGICLPKSLTGPTTGHQPLAPSDGRTLRLPSSDRRKVAVDVLFLPPTDFSFTRRADWR